MGNRNEEQVREFLPNANFDSMKFFRRFVESIFLMKSDYTYSPGDVYESSDDLPAASNMGEFNLNTFYRLCGFPAVRSEAAITKRVDSQSPTDKELNDIYLTQEGAYNLIDFNNLARDYYDAREEVRSEPGTFLLGELSERYILYVNNYSSSKNRQEAFASMIYEPLSVEAGIDGIQNDFRSKPSIFPMIAHADFPVFPKKKRTKQMFKERTTRDLSSRSATFLETIIDIRLRIAASEISGIGFQEIIDKIESELENLQSEEKDEIIKSLSDRNLLEIVAVRKIVTAMKKAAEDHRKTVNEVNKLKQEVRYLPEPVDNPLQKSGLSSREDIDVFNRNRSDNPSMNTDLSELKLAKNKIDLLIGLIPDFKTTKPGGEQTTDISPDLNTFSNDILIDTMIELVTFDAPSISKSISSKENEINKKIQQFERVKSKLMIYSGENFGISLFELLSVYAAFFSVDISILVSLLNRTSFEYLANSDDLSILEDYTVGVEDDNFPIYTQGEALFEFEKKVTEFLRLSQQFFDQALEAGPQ